MFQGWEDGFIEIQNSVSKHLVKVLKNERTSETKINSAMLD
jgi:hypothetical protein